MNEKEKDYEISFLIKKKNKYLNNFRDLNDEF